MNNLITNTFIDPFKSKNMGKIYLSSILGTFGFAGSMIYLAFDTANTDPWTLILFFIGQFAFAGFIYYPLICWLTYKINNKKLFPILIFIQIISLIMSSYLHNIFPDNENITAISIGILHALIASPFWVLFHLLMQDNISPNNKGNEVAIAEIGINIGFISGAIASGIILQYYSDFLFIMLSFISLIISTVILTIMLSRNHKEADYKQAEPDISTFKLLINNPIQAINTAMKGTFGFLTIYSAPAWLKIMGLTGLGIGIITALQIILKIIISPITGHLVNKGKGQELVIGSTIKSIGWLPWLFISSPWIMVWSSLFWTIGLFMYQTGQISRWYSIKTPSAVAAREICLGFGRCLTCLIAIPLLYYDIKIFFAVAFAISIITIATSAIESKRLKKLVG